MRVLTCSIAGCVAGKIFQDCASGDSSSRAGCFTSPKLHVAGSGTRQSSSYRQRRRSDRLREELPDALEAGARLHRCFPRHPALPKAVKTKEEFNLLRAFHGTTNLDLGSLTERFQTRFQSVRLQPPENEVLAAFLARRWAVPIATTRMIAAGVAGNVRAAMADLEMWLG
jgi:hypothetical protein